MTSCLLPNLLALEKVSHPFFNGLESISTLYDESLQENRPISQLEDMRKLASDYTCWVAFRS